MTTVLVVDDSEVDRRLVGRLLEKDARWTIDFAGNGAEALAVFQQSRPDLVVTDLHMPVMDGLALVSAVRCRYPGVPVVLMTAFGTESLAIDALARGAASYVPKSQLADLLPGTVEQVLALSRADRSHARFIRSLICTEFSFALENDPELVDSAVDFVQQVLIGMDLFDPAERLCVGMALDQAMRNALYHGNLELSFEQMQDAREQLICSPGPSLIEQRQTQPPYCLRRLHLAVQITTAEARFVVRDEGPGFDVASLPPMHDPAVLEKEGGRGLVLMHTFMDEVTFNDRGNEVRMWKRKAASPAVEPVAQLL